MYVNDYIEKFKNDGVETQITVSQEKTTVDVFDKNKKYHRTEAVDLIEALQLMDDILFKQEYITKE
jgi:hypothetical protein